MHSKNEVIGGLLRSLDIEKDLYLFNNLYSIKGASSVPIGVPLIKVVLTKRYASDFPMSLPKSLTKEQVYNITVERRKLKQISQ